MVTIVVDEHIPFIRGILEPFARIIYARGGYIDHNLAMQADGIIIRTRTRCDSVLLDGTPVKFIATATIGFDHIDSEYCADNKISWHYAPGCNASSVKQYIASALVTLSLKHKFILQGKKIGIIGVGQVGSKVAQLADAFGIIPLLNDPPRERAEIQGGFVSLEEIQETADIITFHVPLTLEGQDKTFHMTDKSFFRKLLKKPLLINTARGPVIDNQSVKDAISGNNISGFSADVWENEPGLDRELLKLADIGTPHIAGYSIEGKANGTAACVRAASRFFNLGLDDWYPSTLPFPENIDIEIDARSKTDEEIIANAILATYDIMKDDASFRKDPSQFEYLRNYYPARREFNGFRLQLKNPGKEVIRILGEIGFSTNF